MVSLMANIGKPRGHGLIHFDGFDPRAAPVIDSRLLDHPDDRARLVEALQLAERLSRPCSAEPGLPGLAVACALADPARFGVRPSSTSPAPDTTLRDGPHGTGVGPGRRHRSRGRVKGVTGLYVADGSLMPSIPTSNINLATIMI